MSNQQSDTNWNDLSDEQWRERLTPEQYQILRQQGTEAPFSGDFIQVNEHGEYHCAGCGQLLFTGQQQFEGHCGWELSNTVRIVVTACNVLKLSVAAVKATWAMFLTMAQRKQGNAIVLIRWH